MKGLHIKLFVDKYSVWMQFSDEVTLRRQYELWDALHESIKDIRGVETVDVERYGGYLNHADHIADTRAIGAEVLSALYELTPVVAEFYPGTYRIEVTSP